MSVSGAEPAGRGVPVADALTRRRVAAAAFFLRPPRAGAHPDLPADGRGEDPSVSIAGLDDLTPAADRRDEHPATDRIEAVALLGPPEDVCVLAVALAHALGHPAVVCRAATLPHGGGASRAARALALRLADRGLEAAACGRVVHVALPATDADAAVALRRVLAVQVPCVLALDGPRGEAVDALLGDLDRALVVGADALPAGLIDLTLDALAARVPPRTSTRRATGADRWLARAGRSRRSTRRALLADLAARP